MEGESRECSRPTPPRSETMPTRPSSPRRLLAFLVALSLLAAGALTYSGSTESWFGAMLGRIQPVVAAQTATGKHIYSETADPAADIAAALAQAKREHKRVIVDFGGDWCGDCQVLDIYFHRQPNADLLQKHFVLVHVWIGHMDANLAIAGKYGVPLNKGVPALAVLNAYGKVIFVQKTGEFEDMRHMEPGSVTEFLEKWKS
jgi:thiol:disulfide interchange protein